MRILVYILLLLMLFGGSVLAQESISIDNTVEGVLSTGETSLFYEFDGEAGQAVSILMESAAFDTYLLLRTASGDDVAQDDDSGGSLNALIGPVALPETTTYVIEATSLSRSSVGAFSLTLRSVNIDTLSYGQRISGELSQAEPQQSIVFIAEAGDIISIEMSSDSFDTHLELVNRSLPNGRIENDDGGVGTNSRIGPLPIPEAGEYLIIARAHFGDVTSNLSYSLTLNKVEAIPLSLGETAETAITGSAARYFAFEGQAGQIIDILVNSDEQLNTSIGLYDPTSYEVNQSSTGVDGGLDPALMNVQLTQTGLYFAVVEPTTSRDQRTPITVTLLESRIGSLDDGSKTLLFSNNSNIHLLKFAGSAGDRVHLRVSIDALDTLSPRIVAKQNGTQFAEIYTYTIVDEFSFGMMIPGDGDVVIEITEYSYVGAEMTITLER
jgi:hypothetical protein